MGSKPVIYTSIVVGAVSPLLLHGQSERDCNPHIELCPPSDALFLPDGHEPERAPVIYHTGTVAVTSAVVAPGALGVVKLINRPGTSS
jgi:hypothetical protein